MLLNANRLLGRLLGAALFVLPITGLLGCDPGAGEGADLPGTPIERTEKIPQGAAAEAFVTRTVSPEGDPKAREEGFSAPSHPVASIGGDKANCQQQCGNDPVCRVMCIAGTEGVQTPGAGQGGEDCDRCGRETGFLPTPELRTPRQYGSAVLLEWDAVEGASFYEVNGQRWTMVDGQLTEDASYQWMTGGTRMFLTVETGFTYTFYVVARNRDTKRQSLASEPVAVDIQ